MRTDGSAGLRSGSNRARLRPEPFSGQIVEMLCRRPHHSC